MGVIITITATSQEQEQPITEVLHGEDSKEVLFQAVQAFIELVDREDITSITTKKEVTTD
jgi:hypothetical protein